MTAGSGATEPLRSRVVVRGRVGHELAETFGQLELDSNGDESSLTGTFADQVQLNRPLDRLQEVAIPVVSVNPVA
jgi:hypothetical protein